MKFSKRIWFHLVGSITFLVLPILFAPIPPGADLLQYSKPTLRDLLANLFMLAFFYLNYYWIIPKFFLSKKYVVYGLLLASFFSLVCILPSLLIHPFDFGGGPPPFPDGMKPHFRPVPFLSEVSHNIFIFLSVALFSVLVKVRELLLESEVSRQRAEITSLKAQINPHFLFNTLNGIYALALREQAENTAVSLLKLSGMMRYVVTESAHAFIFLEKEIAYIDDYIELQRMRLSKRVQLSYYVSGQIKRQQIAPLLLIPFIENAFKHGVNPDEDSAIIIRIIIEDSRISLFVDNTKVKVRLDPHMQSGHGLEKTKSRLHLLYHGKHFLLLDNGETHFRVQLTIEL